MSPTWFPSFRQRLHDKLKQFRDPFTEKLPAQLQYRSIESTASPVYFLRPPDNFPDLINSNDLPPPPVRIDTPITMDGSNEKKHLGRTRMSTPVSSIFVHAGAGYHSITNEHIHLGACNDAAKMAMKVLKTGGSAVDAVEAAIKVLEDKEITNAGYGSNLTIEGIVECDATMVDHLGRSGACGATAKIKNPINLARLILETSSRPLSLRRVPPNLLVGDGATDFAYEHGMPQVFHDVLISKNARDRFVRWREDLRRAGGTNLTSEPQGSVSSSSAEESLDIDYEDRMKNKERRDHTAALLTSTWNEGQPDSPMRLSPASLANPPSSSPFFNSSPSVTTSPEKHQLLSSSPTRQVSRVPGSAGSSHKRPRIGSSRSSDQVTRTHSLLGQATMMHDTPKSKPEVSVTKHHQSESADGTYSPDDEHPSIDAVFKTKPGGNTGDDEDRITDTVGAIAIDMYGNIAAGSSSGGIGMKHRGRVGPAALVGVGTAVIPYDTDDSDGISVAAVTSGTGEHMATTMAAQKCAERLYAGTRRGRGGRDVVATEEEAIDSFIQTDFMDHPGVRHSHSAGAIGVMAVKKTSYGFFLHFAHNTDSFALASMHSNEKEAKCVMSRMGEHSAVVQGGRKIRVE